MSLLKTWAPYFQSHVRMRGRAYFNSGRVTLLPPQDGQSIRAEVQGTTPYTVTVEDDGLASNVSCTCSHFTQGVYCKHIWATLLAANSDNNGQPDLAVVAPSVASPRPPKARKRSSGQRSSSRSEPEWSDRLSLLHTAAAQAHRPVTVPLLKQIYYAIRADLSPVTTALIVELFQRQPSATGWGKPKPMAIDPYQIGDLPDPLDREICAQLSGASRLKPHDSAETYRPEDRTSAYVLPSSTRRTLIRKMIRTGRCCLNLGPKPSNGWARPLSWDTGKPWTLWLVGLESQQSLTLDLQLRRGDQRLNVSAPSLIIAGPNGLMIHNGQAAPFDDGGANAWLTQTRTRPGIDPDASTQMRVEAHDIPRFLERLFRLPRLPQLDLPPQLAIQIDRGVQPVPHLALVQPAHADRSGVIVQDRQQALAEVWFAYGQTKVLPGQAGRFVSPTNTYEDDTPFPDKIYAGDPSQRPVTAARPDPDPPVSGDPDKGHGPDHATTPNHPVSVLWRDLETEQTALALLAEIGLRPNPNGPDRMDLALPIKLVPECIRTLLAHGWVVTCDQAALHNPGPIKLSVSSGIDWFELRGSVHYDTADGPEDITLPQLLAAAKKGQSMVQLKDGSHGLLPQQWLDEMGLLTAISKVDDDHLSFRASQAALLDILLTQQPFVDVDAKFEAARQRIRRFQGIEPLQAGAEFHGQLRPYQEDGLGWLDFLRWLGVGGILADDMGLGKTIQVLAMLDTEYSNGKPDDAETPASDLPPSLVVVPRSLVFNWVDEATRFAPQLNVLSYTGTDRHSLREVFADHHVIVTSYGLLRRDIAELRDFDFHYVVLDEAQAIKNATSQSAKSARLLRARHRLALTGTPVENHLSDLWSIFEYLNPGMLGSHTRFAKTLRQYSKPSRPLASQPVRDQARGEPELVPAPALPPGLASITKALTPFILRRTKKQVLKHLPEKTEQTIMCQLEPPQRKLYDQLLQHYRTNLMKNLDDGGAGTAGQRLGQQTMMVLEALLRLRQAACHPGLIDPQRADEPSAKTDVLLDRLEDLIEEGHKALVFSQFTSMLSLVRKRLDEHDIVYEYLDGQTRDRKQRVERFQDDPDCPVFLISLKAGGLGLNLTAAEYVFILDPWWNPASEAQAIDRAHRIGQTRHVFAYRLICQDTIEQRISELQARKRDLADAIISGQENPLKNLTRDDLEHLLT